MPRAFTLIELVAIMVVLAIIAAVGIPAALSAFTARPEGAEKQIVRDLTYARARAMTCGRCTWVTFNVAADSYSVLIDDPASPGFAGALALNDPSTGKAMTVLIGRNEFAGVNVTAAAFDADNSVGFDPLGRPIKTSGAVLIADGAVTLAGGHTVTVATPTGRVHGD